MRRSIVALALAAAAGSAAASDRTDVMATVNQFIDGFNKGDVKSALATCASPASIVDEFPPYAWQGPTACADWASDFEANSKKNEITDEVVKLAKPKHVDVTADRAYVVVPASYTYKQKGKKVSQVGSTMVLALRKSATGWLITGWAWATG
jgi:ketosteroid isomerase-like protein